MDGTGYKRLGDYIRQVDVRNRDLAVTNLLGVSISKTFIPSIANTIGTDMSTYKVVEPYQFAYSPVTSRNGDKITFALYKGTERCIISQAYETFEIIDKDKLLPDYLMMWALRPEFDRYARFKSNGSAREIFSWEEMCEVRLPVPDLPTQQKIVSQYQAIESRIATNKKLISNLEATAQAIYKKMFIDDIDPEHLPDGWRIGKLRDIVWTQYGYTASATDDSLGVHLIRITDIVDNMIDWDTVPYCSISDENLSHYKLEPGDVVVSRTGANIGYATQIILSEPIAVFASFLVRIKSVDKAYTWYVGKIVTSDEFKDFVFSNQQGSAQPQANPNVLTSFPCLIPPTDIVVAFGKSYLAIMTYKESLLRENTINHRIASTLLHKVSVD